MYKVLLIDDEPWILKDLELLIDWNKFGFNVMGKVSDSEQALYIIKKQCPDLIICDIRMPGLNGIELMNMVRKRFKDVFVVFVSAYSEFNYAKQAIELGAFDYILKPPEKQEIISTLQRIHLILEQEREKKNKLERYQISELFLEIIEDKLDSHTIRERLKLLGYELSFDYFFIAVVNSIKGNDRDLKWQSELNEYFPYYDLLFIQLGEQKWAVLFNCKSRTLVEKQINDLNEQIANKYSLLIGISDVFNNLSKIKYYYRQSELMAYNYFIYKSCGVYQYSNYNNNYKELSFAIKELNSLDDLKNMLTVLPDLIVSDKINLEEIAYLYNQLREKVHELFKLNIEIELLDSVDIVYSFNDLQELFGQLRDFLLEYETNYRSRESNNIIEKIVEEIQLNYNKDLKLQDLANKYHVNYNYLSQLFKREKGQTFTNYLIEFRIEKAISLFSKDLLFYEIAKKVGYNDYYHFCKIFKKHRGMSPSEFKNLYKE